MYDRVKSKQISHTCRILVNYPAPYTGLVSSCRDNSRRPIKYGGRECVCVRERENERALHVAFTVHPIASDG